MKYFITYLLFAFAYLLGDGQINVLANNGKNPTDPLEKIKVLNATCEKAWLEGNYDLALKYVAQLKILEQRELNKEPDNRLVLKEKAITLNNLAIIYRFKGDYTQSLDHHLQALKIRELINDTQGIARSNLGIGTIYDFIGQKNEALKYKFKALNGFKEAKDTAFVAYTLNHIASIYFDLGKIEEAEKYNRQSLMIFLKKTELTGIQDVYTLAGEIFVRQGKYQDAIDNFESALEVNRSLKLKDRQISLLINLAEVNIKIKNLLLAKKYLDEAMALTNITRAKIQFCDIYKNLAQIDSLTNNYKGSLENYKLFIVYRDSLLNQHTAEKITKLQTQFDAEKVEKQKQLDDYKQDLAHQSEVEQQRIYIYTALIVVILLGVLVILIFKNSLQRKKTNKDLLKKNETIAKQKLEVDEKQKEIVDSITYAKRLQSAILPPNDFVRQYLSNFFIYYQPKDIVAGDFYWAEKVGDLFFIAAADSTGHGVPGAMVSVVCSNALNRTIKEFNLTETGRILDKTRELVMQTFEKSANEVKDGMDISLLCIDSNNKKIFWSGANNPLWYIQNNELIEIKADKQPIGKTDQLKPFTTHTIAYQENTTFYLFTDGLADQFGGPNGKKFKYKQFSDLLLKNHHLSLQQQSEIIHQSFSAWKGKLEQVDDVCIIGIKL